MGAKRRTVVDHHCPGGMLMKCLKVSENGKGSSSWEHESALANQGIVFKPKTETLINTKVK